ncbi:MAG: hypothetical protein M1826_006825 [Phylliscum demangeonii]|nr:MAG: hypothetical protein M1826_006825 [Phylliscum demangeonii]
MEDPNLIAILIPSDNLRRAETAFRHERNKDRYVAPIVVDEGHVFSSRDGTPALDEPIDEHREYETAHRLALSFDEKPKDPTKGFCFGAHPDICDVFLGDRRLGISNIHFYLTFNEKKEPIIRDCSTRGTAVSYSGQASDQLRNHFTWILSPPKEEGSWDIEVHLSQLSFKVILAEHLARAKEYDGNVDGFLHEDPTLGGLAIYTPTEPASLSLSPRRPIYIRERELGRGAFGLVDKVINVSSGAIYARKQFYEPRWERRDKWKEQQREEWLHRVQREIRIMKENRHENIVEVVDDQTRLPPFLVMPYYPLGNLQDQHRGNALTRGEVVHLLDQALSALEYLHERGVAHRDLKPDNLLIESRFPFRMKLADFGLANDQPGFETICGTPIYVAPEIYQRREYTVAVDLWSLGVIALEYAYGLPDSELRNAWVLTETWGLSWCRRIANSVRNPHSDGLLDLLAAGLIQMAPHKRLSANACLIRGYQTGLFGGQSDGSGSATPRPKPTVLGGASNDQSITTIWGNLWNQDDASHPLDSQIGRIAVAPVTTDNDDHLLADSSGPGASAISREGAKRLRSPAIHSSDSFSDRGRAKRRPLDLCPAKLPVSTSDGKVDQYSSLRDTIVALLTDLRLGDGKSEKMELDAHAYALIEELCESLAQLELTEMRLARNDRSGQAIIATGSNCREIVVASLTSSELMSSYTELVKHLLLMVQFQSPPVPGPPVPCPPTEQCPVDATTPDGPAWGQSVDTIRSDTTPDARKNGITYPSALLDCVNISGCSTLSTEEDDDAHDA